MGKHKSIWHYYYYYYYNNNYYYYYFYYYDYYYPLIMSQAPSWCTRTTILA
jgi:hypothetical protein